MPGIYEYKRIVQVALECGHSRWFSALEVLPGEIGCLVCIPQNEEKREPGLIESFNFSRN